MHPALPTLENEMADLHENLIDWLRDAYAMEQQAEQMLKARPHVLSTTPR
jgi:ferritin-like metal-binding protein YciE